jgi:hypothetical protein
MRVKIIIDSQNIEEEMDEDFSEMDENLTNRKKRRLMS